MNNVQNLPTKSELYGKTNKNQDDFITLNIYKNVNLNNEESNIDINQTETNLNLENMSFQKQKEYLEKFQKKAMLLDNTRNNPYPLSEYRETQMPAPPIYNQNANFSKTINPFNNNIINKNYSQSVNPYNNNNIQNNNQTNKNRIYNYNNQLSTEKRLKPNLNNAHQHNLGKINEVQSVKKKKDKMTSKQICICILLTLLYPPCGIIYCCCILYCDKKKNNNNNEN